MPSTDENKSGGHSHPQNSGQNGNDQRSGGKNSPSKDQGPGGKEGQPKESFGSSGPKDNHLINRVIRAW